VNPAIAAVLLIVGGLIGLIFAVYLLQFVLGAIQRLITGPTHTTVKDLGFAPYKEPAPEPDVPDRSKRTDKDEPYAPKEGRFTPRPRRQLPPPETLAALPLGATCEHCEAMLIPNSQGDCENCGAPFALDR